MASTAGWTAAAVTLLVYIVAASGETCPEAKARIEGECQGLGCFRPLCDGDDWEPVQYKGSGSSCVSRDGKAIKGFEWTEGFSTDCWCARYKHEGLDVNCNADGSYAETCEEAKARERLACNGRLGCPDPQCDGIYWAPVQFLGSGTSCVTKFGEPIVGFEWKQNGFGTTCHCARFSHDGQEVDCNEDGSFKSCPDHKAAEAERCLPGMAGCPDPLCDGDAWAAVQHHGGGAHCVDPLGRKIEPFSWGYGSYSTSDCQCARQKFDGRNVNCNEDGSFVSCLDRKAYEAERCLPGMGGCPDPQCDGDDWAAVQHQGAGAYCADRHGNKIGDFSWFYYEYSTSDCQCAREYAAGANILCKPDGSHPSADDDNDTPAAS